MGLGANKSDPLPSLFLGAIRIFLGLAVGLCVDSALERFLLVMHWTESSQQQWCVCVFFRPLR